MEKKKRMDAFFQFTKLSTFQCIPISLSSFFFSLYISKFPFYIQRHYRKAFNSSHNVLCIWILKEEMETFFAATSPPPRKAKENFRKKSFFDTAKNVWKWICVFWITCKSFLWMIDFVMLVLGVWLLRLKIYLAKVLQKIS